MKTKYLTLNLPLNANIDNEDDNNNTICKNMTNCQKILLILSYLLIIYILYTCIKLLIDKKYN